MAKGDLKIIGMTISITWLAFITLAVFIKAIGILFNDFFVNNVMIIAIISGIMLLFLVTIGAISFRALTSNGKGIFR